MNLNKAGYSPEVASPIDITNIKDQKVRGLSNALNALPIHKADFCSIVPLLEHITDNERMLLSSPDTISIDNIKNIQNANLIAPNITQEQHLLAEKRVLDYLKKLSVGIIFITKLINDKKKDSIAHGIWSLGIPESKILLLNKLSTQFAHLHETHYNDNQKIIEKGEVHYAFREYQYKVNNPTPGQKSPEEKLLKTLSNIDQLLRTIGEFIYDIRDLLTLESEKHVVAKLHKRANDLETIQAIIRTVNQLMIQLRSTALENLEVETKMPLANQQEITTPKVETNKPVSRAVVNNNSLLNKFSRATLHQVAQKDNTSHEKEHIETYNDYRKKLQTLRLIQQAKNQTTYNDTIQNLIKNQVINGSGPQIKLELAKIAEDLQNNRISLSSYFIVESLLLKEQSKHILEYEKKQTNLQNEQSIKEFETAEAKKQALETRRNQEQNTTRSANILKQSLESSKIDMQKALNAESVVGMRAVDITGYANLGKKVQQANKEYAQNLDAAKKAEQTAQLTQGRTVGTINTLNVMNTVAEQLSFLAVLPNGQDKAIKGLNPDKKQVLFDITNELLYSDEKEKEKIYMKIGVMNTTIKEKIDQLLPKLQFMKDPTNPNVNIFGFMF